MVFLWWQLENILEKFKIDKLIQSKIYILKYIEQKIVFKLINKILLKYTFSLKLFVYSLLDYI